MNRINEMLKNLEGALRDGLVTPARSVDSLTLVCLTESNPYGGMYHQMPFELLNEGTQAALKGKVKGDTVGPFRIVAVFDTWPPTHGPKDVG